ncbi:MAG: hypothetical protein ACKO57_00340, partial [Alphaproteobacteria bacterium]
CSTKTKSMAFTHKKPIDNTFNIPHPHQKTKKKISKTICHPRMGVAQQGKPKKCDVSHDEALGFWLFVLGVFDLGGGAGDGGGGFFDMAR